MKNRSACFGHKPFASLGKRLARKKIELPEVHVPVLPSRPLTPSEERALFLAAVSDVTPLTRKRRTVTVGNTAPEKKTIPIEDPDLEAMNQLKRLVETGEGFVLRHTSEYLEGAGTYVPPEIFRRLHNGHFSIQGHIDLHGMDVVTAKSVFDRFMERSLSLGSRTVLIVHGRGKKSPGLPVLKQNLVLWLTKGRWKKWVIAFTSARSCDGGTGATYLLLKKTVGKTG